MTKLNQSTKILDFNFPKIAKRLEFGRIKHNVVQIWEMGERNPYEGTFFCIWVRFLKESSSGDAFFPISPDESGQNIDQW